MSKEENTTVWKEHVQPTQRATSTAKQNGKQVVVPLHAEQCVPSKSLQNLIEYFVQQLQTKRCKKGRHGWQKESTLATALRKSNRRVQKTCKNVENRNTGGEIRSATQAICGVMPTKMLQILHHGWQLLLERQQKKHGVVAKMAHTSCLFLSYLIFLQTCILL